MAISTHGPESVWHALVSGPRAFFLRQVFSPKMRWPDISFLPMKTTLLLSCLGLVLVSLRAESQSSVSAKPDDKIIAAVRAADDERVAAILGADKARLDAIFSDDLHYTHSSGKIDNKASYTQALVTKATTYDRYEYLDRKFIPVSPGIVLMTAHALINSRSATGVNENDLSILAVYREEKGKWRFLAWQSAKLPAPATAAAKKK